jgi:hypothetical protein
LRLRNGTKEVDSPEDAITAAEIIGREGELVEVLN